MTVFTDGSYLLFDDDCGVCTTFSHLFKRLLGDRVELVPMHIPQVEQAGLNQIPDSYWTSFHIVYDGNWTTEREAIITLASLFPFGSILKKIVSFPLVLKVLMYILRQMQHQRKAECSVDL